MITEIFATGKTVNDAVEALKEKLAVDSLDDIDWSLVTAGKKGGLFGLGIHHDSTYWLVQPVDNRHIWFLSRCA